MIFFFNKIKINYFDNDNNLFKLNVRQLKLFFSLISILNYSKELQLLQPIEINSRHIINHFGYSNNYDLLKKELNELSELILNGDSVFHSIEFIPDRGIICVRFKAMYKLFIKKLDKNYILLNLNDIMRLKYRFSVILYCVLKQYNKLRNKTISINDLNKLFNENYDLRYLVRNRIDKAVDDINNNTDIKIKYIKIKENRYVTGFKFIISNNTDIINQNKEINKIYKYAWSEYRLNLDITKIKDLINLIGFNKVYENTKKFIPSRMSYSQDMFFKNQLSS